MKALQRGDLGQPRPSLRLCPSDFVHADGVVETFGYYIAQVRERQIFALALVQHHLSN
jgi:hypothetical protein